jgi:hypothetical protein
MIFGIIIGGSLGSPLSIATERSMNLLIKSSLALL